MQSWAFFRLEGPKLEVVALCEKSLSKGQAGILTSKYFRRQRAHFHSDHLPSGKGPPLMQPTSIGVFNGRLTKGGKEVRRPWSLFPLNCFRWQEKEPSSIKTMTLSTLACSVNHQFSGFTHLCADLLRHQVFYFHQTSYPIARWQPKCTKLAPESHLFEVAIRGFVSRCE
jgi:hypothetical protein